MESPDAGFGARGGRRLAIRGCDCDVGAYLRR